MAISRPKFFEKNLITDVSIITDDASTNDTNKIKLIDRNELTQYKTFGDIIPAWNLYFDFPVPVTISRIILQNINWFNLFFNKLNPLTIFSVPNLNKHKNLYIELPTPFTDTQFQFSIGSTFNPNEMATAGQIILTNEIFEIDEKTGHFIEPTTRNVQRNIRLSDGTVQKSFIRQNFDYDIDFEGVSSDERQNFIDLYDRNRRQSFVFIPEPATQPDEWNGRGGHYNIDDIEFERYTLDNRLSGYDGSINLVQAGGVR